jgi:hypothetical protein
MDKGQSLSELLNNSIISLKKCYWSLLLFRFFVWSFLVFFFLAVIYLELGTEWIKKINDLLYVADLGLNAVLIFLVGWLVNKLDIKALYFLFLFSSFLFIIYCESLLFNCGRTKTKLLSIYKT